MSTIDSYYRLLGISPDASDSEIAEAYQRQRERYNTERVADLSPDFQQLAAARTAELDKAFAVLSDRERRLSGGQPATPVPAARTRLSRRELLMAAGGALVGLLLIGIVWTLAGRATPADLPPVATINRPAQDFTLTDTQGNPVSLSNYRGKVVLLNFWYTQCQPCLEETPALEAIYQKLADQGLVVLGVNVRANERAGSAGDDDVRAFTQRFGVTYPIVFDRDGAVGRSFQVYVLPTSLFIDQNGTARYARFSSLTADDVEQIFTKLQRETN